MISFMVALNCEARALIDFYGLKKKDDGPFAYFVAPDSKKEVELVVTGMGAISVAAAIGWLAATSPKQNRVWLNFGIAGHASLDIGQLVLVHGCADAVQGRAHYPPLVAKWSAKPTAACLSHNAPSTDYIGDALSDMEAYGFFTAALKFSNSELVQSLKVVSDNSEADMAALDAKLIEKLLLPHTETVAYFAESLLTLEATRQADILPKLELPSVRATHSQQRLIDSLEEKARVLNCIDGDFRSKVSTATTAKQLIEILNQQTQLVSPDLRIVTAR